MACAVFVPSISNADETNSLQPGPALQTISLGETSGPTISDAELTASPGSHRQTVFVSTDIETDESAPIVSAPIVEVLALALFTIVAFVLGARYAYRTSYR